MTASSPITADDLVDNLILYSDTTEWKVRHNEAQNRYGLTDGTHIGNSVEVSEDGLTVSFGSTVSDPTFTGFTFNA